MLFESQLVIEDYNQYFLTELDGVIVEEPSWMEKSCCRVGVAGKMSCIYSLIVQTLSAELGRKLG